MFRLIIKNEVLDDYVHEIEDEIVLVGRVPDCALRLNVKEVSRFHARLEHRGRAGLSVEDLGSSNGTWVNNTRITEVTSLQHGDTVRFGSIVALVELKHPPSSGAVDATVSSNAAEPAGAAGIRRSAVLAAAGFLALAGAAVALVLFNGNGGNGSRAEDAPPDVTPKTAKSAVPAISAVPDSRPAPADENEPDAATNLKEPESSEPEATTPREPLTL